MGVAGDLNLLCVDETIFGGAPQKGDNIKSSFLPCRNKKVRMGLRGGGSEPHSDIPRHVRLREACKGKLDVHMHEFILDHSNEATDTVRSGDAGRVLVAMA